MSHSGVRSLASAIEASLSFIVMPSEGWETGKVAEPLPDVGAAGSLEKLASLVEGFHAPLFVQTMRVGLIGRGEHAAHAVSRNAGIHEETPIGGAGAHGRRNGHAGPDVHSLTS